jgi:hypothetical protein
MFSSELAADDRLLRLIEIEQGARKAIAHRDVVSLARHRPAPSITVSISEGSANTSVPSWRGAVDCRTREIPACSGRAAGIAAVRLARLGLF